MKVSQSRALETLLAHESMMTGESVLLEDALLSLQVADQVGMKLLSSARYVPPEDTSSVIHYLDTLALHNVGFPCVPPLDRNMRCSVLVRPACCLTDETLDGPCITNLASGTCFVPEGSIHD